MASPDKLLPKKRVEMSFAPNGKNVRNRFIPPLAPDAVETIRGVLAPSPPYIEYDEHGRLTGTTHPKYDFGDDDETAREHYANYSHFLAQMTGYTLVEGMVDDQSAAGRRADEEAGRYLKAAEAERAWRSNAM